MGDRKTVAEVAALAGVSRATVYMFLKRHNTPCHRIGKNLMIRLEDLSEMRVRLGAVLSAIQEQEARIAS